MTLVPAYGRDYTSKKAVIADWNADKDFEIADLFGGNCGRKINRSDAIAGGIRSVNIRYKQLRSVAVVKVG